MKDVLRVSHIERFATHDGPGIRTTVFLKGCPLHCPWCSNPETQSFLPEIMHKKETCCHCAFCQEACRSGAIMVEKDTWVFDRAKCDGCARCVWACVNDCLELRGTDAPIADVVELCLKDKDYYETSDGGVTVSGGEPLAQADAVLALADALHEAGVTVAIESCLQAPLATVRRVVGTMDHVLCDCKHIDESKLRDVCGADASVVLGNLRWIAEHAADRTRIRVPVIPGFNDDAAELTAIIDWLAEAGFCAVDLLPYHAYAIGKYDRLHRAYTYPRSSLKEEALEPYCAYAIERGLDCRIGA